MQKKGIWIVLAIVIIAALVGGYFVMHKSSKDNPTPASTTPATATNSTSGTQATPVNNAVVITKTSSSAGQYLADPSGKTLYIYTSDSNGTSNCSGGCLATWPAYTASSTTTLPTDITVITRSDNGQKQYAYKGLPLYYFLSDKSAGQVTGDNVAGFKVATP